MGRMNIPNIMPQQGEFLGNLADFISNKHMQQQQAMAAKLAAQQQQENWQAQFGLNQIAAQLAMQKAMDEHNANQLKIDPVKAGAFIDALFGGQMNGQQPQPSQESNAPPLAPNAGAMPPQAAPAQAPNGDFDVDANGNVVKPATQTQPQIAPNLSGIKSVDQYMNGDNSTPSSDPRINALNEKMKKDVAAYNKINGTQGAAPTAPKNLKQLWQQIAKDPAKATLVKNALGIDASIINKETPEEKRSNDLQSQKDLEAYKKSLETQSVRETAKERGIGEYESKSYGAALDSSQVMHAKLDNLNAMVRTLESNPNPQAVVGPVNSWATKVFGDPDQQKMLGELMSSGGNFVLASAKDIKGAFTGRDQTLLNNAKPNPTDPYFVFTGKLKSQAEYLDLASRRMDIYAKELENKKSPTEAMRIAREQTSFEKIDAHYKKVIGIAEKRAEMQRGNIPTFASDSEKKDFLKSLSKEEKIKLLNRM